MKTINVARLLMTASVVMGPAPAWAQGGSTLNAVVERLDLLERQNAELRDRLERQKAELRDQFEQQKAELREQVGQLRQELDRFKQAGPEGTASTSDGALSTAARVDALEETVEVNAGRLSEQDQVKVEGSQRAPLRVTGMALFNVYANGRHGGLVDYPWGAQVSPGNINSGATMRGSIFGLAFNSPAAVLGGQFHGSVLVDLFGDGANSGPIVNIRPRFRVASVEGQWGTRSVVVGQDKVIFSPREPTSLGINAFSPLIGAGNLYGWRPQVRFEQRIGLGASQDFRARIGVVETFEDWPLIPAEFTSSLELRRPALEGHFQFSHRFDDVRRFEIGSGFHRSATHVAQTSIPSTALSVDGFLKPLRWLELTGFAFTGKNVAHMSLRNFSGFTILRPSPGEIQAIPVRHRGGWAQATLLATPRLSFNVYGGVEDANDDDVMIATAIVRNAAFAINAHYRVAPNVIVGVELSQARTSYKAGQTPQNNHYDLFLAYLF